MSLPGLPRDEKGRLESYAFPGGYQLYYYDRDHSVMCPPCARKSDEDADEIPSFKPAFVGVNYEEIDLYCEQCSKRIPSSYSEDDATDKNVYQENEQQAELDYAQKHGHLPIGEDAAY